MSSVASHIMAATINLTRQEDQVALRQALLDGIREVAHFDKVSLFEIKSDLQDQEAGIAYYRDAMEPGAHFENLERRQTLLKAMRLREVVQGTVKHGDQLLKRYAMPIMSSGHVCEILALESGNGLEEFLKDVQFLVDIYRNHSRMLHKYEHDALTGLLNRRSFEDRLSHFMRQLAESQQSLALLDLKRHEVPHLAVLDIDHFKRINDNYGHLYGDDVLLLFSNQMREQFSAETSLYRFGGEEFVVVMHSTSVDAVEQLEQFREAIERFDFPQVGQVTVSIGYTSVTSSSVSSEIIDRADQALYFAKENGRNRVCCYEELVSQGAIEQGREQDGGEIELF